MAEKGSGEEKSRAFVASEENIWNILTLGNQNGQKLI